MKNTEFGAFPTKQVYFKQIVHLIFKEFKTKLPFLTK